MVWRVLETFRERDRKSLDTCAPQQELWGALRVCSPARGGVFMLFLEAIWRLCPKRETESERDKEGKI
jgi:hypothetical protein